MRWSVWSRPWTSFAACRRSVAVWFGWLMTGVAFVLGWWQWRWPGVALVFTVVVFWLLLQFSQALRALRFASARPVGHVDSAVMLHARLHKGMRLTHVLRHSKSLGRRVSEEPEVFSWADEAGDEVRITLGHGRLTHWELIRHQPKEAGHVH